MKYALVIGALAICLSLLFIVPCILNRLPSIKTGILRVLIYPIVFQRGSSASVTRFQAAIVGSYMIINGFCMGLGIRTSSELMVRCGVMASINIIPLFLGGRTNYFSNLLGISLHTYYLAHHWIGRIVIFQSLLHVALVVSSGKPWTLDSSQIFGISVSC